MAFKDNKVKFTQHHKSMKAPAPICSDIKF